MASPLEKLLIGRTLVGRYEVERVIGRGGMSLVYRAIDLRLDRPIALKIISFPQDLPEGERAMLRERLRREAASAAKLSPHPNVVQVYDYGTHEELDLDFIAMELLPGDDLKTVMREHVVPFDEATRILVAAARGLAAGHRAGIVHRDIKPGNIFLAHAPDDHGPAVVKILDFGIAKALEGELDDDLTRHGSIPHSPAYAAPEQLGSGGPIGPASDVYQLGLVAYELLAGERPFTDAERVRIRAGEEVPLPSRGRWMEVPDPLRAVVARALKQDPRDRYVDARELGAAIESPPTHPLGERVGTGAAGSAAGTETLWMAQDEAETPPTGVGSPAAESPPAAREVRGRAPARARNGISPGLLGAGIAGASLIAILVVVMGDGEEQGASTVVDDAAVVEGNEAAGATDEIEALHEEFRPLLVEAFETVREQVSALEGQEAAEAVRDVLFAIQEAYVEGDVDRLNSYYAERLDYRGSNVGRESVIAERDELVDRYGDREIVIPRSATEFIAPGRARVLVDRNWRFENDDEVWEGAVRDEMILERQGDQWRVVSERELESFGEQRDRT